jgi:uncharacterized protein (DUF4415 family)
MAACIPSLLRHDNDELRVISFRKANRKEEKLNERHSKPSPSRPDPDNPEWTRKDMANARQAAEVLPELIGAKATEELFRRFRGRPPKATRKVNQTIRLDPDVLAACQHEGRGWQTLINAVLRQHMPGHPK